VFWALKVVQGVHTRVIENSEKPVQGVCKNSVRSSVRSVPGGHTRTSHKLRRDSARSAQSECKECAYTQSSVKSQGKASARSAFI
jgi:hypothetical protein